MLTGTFFFTFSPPWRKNFPSYDESRTSSVMYVPCHWCIDFHQITSRLRDKYESDDNNFFFSQCNIFLILPYNPLRKKCVGELKEIAIRQYIKITSNCPFVSFSLSLFPSLYLSLPIYPSLSLSPFLLSICRFLALSLSLFLPSFLPLHNFCTIHVVSQ